MIKKLIWADIRILVLNFHALMLLYLAKLDVSRHAHQCFVQASSEGSGEPAHSLLVNVISTKTLSTGPYIN